LALDYVDFRCHSMLLIVLFRSEWPSSLLNIVFDVVLGFAGAAAVAGILTLRRNRLYPKPQPKPESYIDIGPHSYGQRNGHNFSAAIANLATFETAALRRHAAPLRWPGSMAQPVSG
jgi:hypothetical protein